MNKFDKLILENIRLKALIKSQDTMLHSIATQNNYLTKDKEELLNQNTYLKSILLGFQSSNSWKLTAPYRFIGIFFHRLKKSIFR